MAAGAMGREGGVGVVHDAKVSAPRVLFFAAVVATAAASVACTLTTPLDGISDSTQDASAPPIDTGVDASSDGEAPDDAPPARCSDPTLWTAPEVVRLAVGGGKAFDPYFLPDGKT